LIKVIINYSIYNTILSGTLFNYRDTYNTALAEFFPIKYDHPIPETAKEQKIRSIVF